MGAVVVVVEMAFGARYGVFRDEMYYLACADHLALGYVDHPPLSIAVLAGVRALLGDALPALRIVPALLAGGLVVITGLIARTLGGGRFAQALAALAAAIAPLYLAVGGFYSMNGFDLVFWALAIWLFARIIAEDSPGLYLPLGLVLGLGLENKISVLFLGAGLAAGIVATPLRRHLRRREPWLALALVAVLFLPHILWQIANGWPTLEFMANATRSKNVALSPLAFALEQILQIHPFNAVLWIAGLVWLLAGRFRAVGIVYLVAFAILVVSHGKPYYLGPAYPQLLAAGALLVERLRRAWLRGAVAAALAAGGALTAPLVIPVLPVDTLIAYQKALGLAPAAAEHQALGPLPQHFADRFGWEEMTAAVAAIYRSLPDDERARVVIVADNYGEAAALTYHGRRFGLPPAVSQHNNYFLWGPGRDRVDVAIIVGMRAEDLRDAWGDIQEVPWVGSPYAMPYETARPILVCRGLRLPLDEAWRAGRRFI